MPLYVGSVLDRLGIPYAIMGGSACMLLGSHRTTTDIDLCIAVTTSMGDASRVSAALMSQPSFTGIDADGIGYITPAVTGFTRDPIPIEIFDPEAWPNRPQYIFTATNRLRLQSGATVFSPPLASPREDSLVRRTHQA